MVGVVETDAVFDPDYEHKAPATHGPFLRAFYILFGLGLCFTGVGAILGVPLILWELGNIPVRIPPGIRTGPCPKCHKDLFLLKEVPATTCPICRARVVVTGDKFQVFS